MQRNHQQSSGGIIPSEEEIQSWLVKQVANAVYMDPDEIDVNASFNSFGLSSRDAVLLSGDLEEWLDRRLSPTLIYEYPSIQALAVYLSVPIDNRRSPIDQKHLEGQKSSIESEKDASPGFINPTTSETSGLVGDLENISEEEAELLLLEKLNKLNST